MHYRQLGSTGLNVSVLSYGASPLGNAFRTIDDNEGIRTVRTALDLGINFLDTSPHYGETKSETVLGRALKGRLAAHFAPILDAPLPERLTAPLAAADTKVVDFAAARQKRTRRSIPRWSWLVGPALAASLALAVFMPRGGAEPEGYADPQLASALDKARSVLAGL